MMLDKKLENRFLIGITIFITSCFLFFLTSKLWMYDDEPINQTSFNTVLNGLSQTEIILNSWEYNPKTQTMEVFLNLKQTGTDPFKPTYEFSARAPKSDKQYEVTIAFQENENVVLQIHSVPADYKLIGLFVKENRDSSVVDASMEDKSNSIELEKERVLVGDYRKVTLNEELQIRSEKEYQREFVYQEIATLQKRNQWLVENQLPQQRKLIANYEQEINKLKERLSYETKAEKKETTELIHYKEQSIESVQEKKEELHLEIDVLKEKEKMLHQRLKDIEGKVVKSNEKK